MYYLIAILSVLAASGAQMLLKKGALIKYKSFAGEYLNPWVISGYLILGLSLIVNIYAMSLGLKVKELSIIEGLSYLFVPLLGYLCFKERVSKKKFGAIAIILAGVALFFL